MILGLEIDEPIEGVISRLNAKGAKISGPVINDMSGRFVHFDDPDGNEIYFWETVAAEALLQR